MIGAPGALCEDLVKIIKCSYKMDPKFAFLIFKKRAEDIDFSLLDDLVNVGKAGLRVDAYGIFVDGYIV